MIGSPPPNMLFAAEIMRLEGIECGPTAGLPAWQIVMHVVNHGTLHRDQIVGMLRQLKVKPATGIIFFYYEQETAAAS